MSMSAENAAIFEEMNAGERQELEQLLKQVHEVEEMTYAAWTATHSLLLRLGVLIGSTRA